MKLNELQKIINQYSEKESEKLSVVIRLNEDSIGPIATESIKYATAGFDWEMGKFILTPEKPLEHFKEKRELDKEIPKYIRKIGDTTICRCSKCKVDIDPLDKYCRNCGQKFLEK